MRLTSAVRRPWLAVPLLLSIASVMALSNASLSCDNDNDKDSSNNCPPLASVDTRSVVRIPSLERPGGLDLLGPLAAAPDDNGSAPNRKTSSTTTPAPTPKPKPKPSKPKPKPKPKPKHKTKSTSSKQKSKTTATSKSHATPLRPITSNNMTPNPNRTKTHTVTTTPQVVLPTTTSAQPESSSPPPLPPTAPPGPIGQTTTTEEPTPTDSVAPPTAGEPTTVGVTQDSSTATMTPAPTPTGSSAPATTLSQLPEETTPFSRPNHPPRETVSDSFNVPTPSTVIEPTPVSTSTLAVNATTATTFVLPSITTTPIPKTTSTTSSTTTTTTQPPTATPSTATTLHHPHPTTTTTPWLPSTIEPLAPPKTTSTARPGTSLPEIVIPNLNPDIPANSFSVVLRLEHVSYYQVINNGVLAAQLVSFLPTQLGRVLNVDTSLVQVLAIRDGSSKPLAVNGATAPPPAPPRSITTSVSTAATTTTATKNKRSARKRGLVTSPNSSDAILVTVSIPRNKYWPLNNLVVDRSSSLYVQEAQSFGQFVDSNYALASHPPSLSRGGGGSSDGNGENGGNDGNITADPLTGDNPSLIPGPDGNKGGSSKTSQAPIIGSVVALATIAYVGIAIVVVRKFQAKKLREQQEREAIRQNISGPINVQGGANGWGWHEE